MENIDPRLEQRVWSRVHGEPAPQPDHQTLPALIAAESEAAAMYRHLAERLPSRHRQTLLRMAREEETHRNILLGMHRLMTGHHYAPPKTVPPARSPFIAALRRCYTGELRSIAAYEARVEDPEYGTIFARMANEEIEHSRLLLKILGELT